MHTTTRTSRRGFSLLELLVVMAILVVVMSIVIPALSSFRNAARKAATQGLMAGVSTAIGTYNLDQRRLPGYFSAREMGNNTNNDFSVMENMLLDLAGGITTDTGAQILRVGPGAPAQPVSVDPTRIGAATQTSTGTVSKTYFTPDPKFFIKQNGTNQRAEANGAAKQMPVLVDAWGSPILAWAQDDVATDTFAAPDSRTARAKFYAHSNHAFLKATSLGKLAISQTDSTVGSLLSGSLSDGAITKTMESLLGNSSFPDDANSATPKPTAARSPIVMHSAGVNGVYLGKNERGGRAAGTNGLQYRPNVDSIEGGGFDDFLVTAQ